MLEDTSGVFPWATLFVNLTGSFLLAVLAAVIKQQKLKNSIFQYGLAAGLLASFTTFSNFSLDIMLLLENSTFQVIAGYTGASVFGGGLFAWIGWKGMNFLLTKPAR